MNYLIIYLIGCVMAYLLQKFVDIENSKIIFRVSYKKNWVEVKESLIIIFLSYISLLLLVICYIIDKFKNKKPPKWI